MKKHYCDVCGEEFDAELPVFAKAQDVGVSSPDRRFAYLQRRTKAREQNLYGIVSVKIEMALMVSASPLKSNLDTYRKGESSPQADVCPACFWDAILEERPEHAKRLATPLVGSPPDDGRLESLILSGPKK